jgi:pimeloyl-ACP methyl ester carboxylesterase
MHGARSPIAAQRVVAILAAALPRATLCPIDGAGHMGPITHEGAVERAVVEHLARASA